MVNDTWFSLGEIRYTRPQIIYLIRHFDLLLDFVWPSDHKISGYSGQKGRARGHSAPFEKVAQIMAELTSRLDRVGRDSLLLLIVYSKDLEQQYYIRDFLSKCLRIDAVELDKRIDNALRYISGKWARKRSYKQFCQHKGGKKWD